MKTPLVILATLLGMLAIYLPTRSQAFTRITVDGRGMRLGVAGSGPATVVFESGAGATLEMWAKVQPAVSKYARTVSYDRAGVGLSDGPRQRDARRIAASLRRALEGAQIPPPFILVGASIGGRYNRVFAGMYPDDVAAMILVDPTPDNELIDDPTLEQAQSSQLRPGLPVFLIDAISPEEVPFATNAIRALRLRNRPEIEAESEEHRRWIGTIPGGQLIITHQSGHNVPIEQPRLVIDTIKLAIDEVQRARH